MSLNAQADRGYGLWLSFRPLSDSGLRDTYREQFGAIRMHTGSTTREIVFRELQQGLGALLSSPVGTGSQDPDTDLLWVETWDVLPASVKNGLEKAPQGPEGFLLTRIEAPGRNTFLLTARSDMGLLYGAYRLLRLLQAETPMQQLEWDDQPKTALRMLNHWDNLDRTVERGYAGLSIWNWHTLPGYLDPRYEEYARANASIGINATALTNVNANATVLSPQYLQKVAALAAVFRPYGIRVFLTARFSAPMELGGLPTADPLDPAVGRWWAAKAREIYAAIPDFGGFLVKANSEGQPGPQSFGRTHLEGANMMADALAPFGGLVIWRAFVYSEEDPEDRAKQAFSEFRPYDGQFRDNVLLQVKNGPVDFQPREPIHPLFGAMPGTPLMMEFQITKEYLGFSTHTVFMPRLFEEVLQTDTYRRGPGSTVSRVVDGSLHGKALSGMAGVSNIGNDPNWTGHPLAQADWFGFGRLAWDPDIESSTIAEEWIRATLGNDQVLIRDLSQLFEMSREAVVNYMMPLGLHHLFDTGHHYGPGPWVDYLSRPEWNPVYYHQADADGIGFDRTSAGSDALSQYAPAFAEQFRDPGVCPDRYLLWFHHLPWDFRMKDGNSLWNALGLKYQEGVDTVREMIRIWEGLDGKVPTGIHKEVSMLLRVQLAEAVWWKDACMSYFQSLSGKPYPEGMEPPRYPLSHYKAKRFPYAPGIRPRWD